MRKVKRLSNNQGAAAIYGGQAVIEGVMMGGRHVNVTAVRRKNNEISFYEVPRADKKWVTNLKKIPFIRGLVSIIDSSAKGAKHLNFATEKYAEDEEGPVEESEKKGWDLTMVLGVAIVGILSFIFGKVIFTATPAIIEQILFGKLFDGKVLHTMIEGVIKIILLLVYLYVISLTPLIKRLFMYHGAEHKVISAHEAGVELTVKNVQKFSRLHYRCGSSFIVFTVIVGVIIYSFVSYDTLWDRVLWRLALLPVVIGVSYEVLRLTNAVRDIPVLRFLGYPGLWLQKLTTKEPTDDMVEVSIASFKRMLELDQQMSLNKVS